MTRDRTSAAPVRLLVPPREAAELLSVSERTLWTLTHIGRIPALRFGRLVRYDVVALREWLRMEAQRQKSEKLLAIRAPAP